MAEDILNKVFSFIAGGNEDDTDRRILLQKLQRDLSQNKYARFYKVRSEEFESDLAQVFHSLSKMLYPLQALIQDKIRLNWLKTVTVETFLSPAAREAVRRLSPQAIEQRSASESQRSANESQGDKGLALTGELKGDLQVMTDAFDRGRITAIDRCYTLIQALLRLAGFNYTALLAKFDEHFQAHPGYEPKFGSAKAAGLVKDLAAFMLLIPPLDPNGDWKNAAGIVNTVAGAQVLDLESFAGMVRTLRDLQGSGILDLMVQYTIKNPLWVQVSKVPEEHLAETWLEIKRAEAQKVIGRIVESQRDVLIASQAVSVFGVAEVNRLNYYTLKFSESIRRRGLDGFVYAPGINYLAAFLEDFQSRELQELCDIVLVRGQWTSQALSREMSEALYAVKGLSGGIVDLDESLGEAGRDGPRLNTALLRVDHDPAQARYIAAMVDGIDERALELINIAAQAYNVMARHLRNLAEDCQKKPGEIIINWRELSMVSRVPINQRIAGDYARLSGFVQLLQFYSGPQAS
ncbi:MAG: hypothetical protein LBT11_00830 [Treponema sp.]|jgi:hypothetical protein|nr:hypothetical protein [Treponema sp.]